MDKARIKHRIDRIKKKLEDYDLSKPNEKYNYDGGFSVGYLKGKLAVLEDLLDEEDDEESSDSSSWIFICGMMSGVGILLITLQLIGLFI